MSSRNLFLGFAGLVALASVSAMFGGDMFPAEADPVGNPETWTVEELRRWLKRVCNGQLENEIHDANSDNRGTTWLQAQT